MNREAARLWIEHEDDVAREDRIERLQWLAANYPSSANGFLVNGGWLSIQLLEEARYCFAYGQFTATTILGVALIERCLAAQFYAAGRNDLERSSGANLLQEALTGGWISLDEFNHFHRVRRLRNPLVHFRRPLARDTVEYRAVQESAHPDEVVEGDAQKTLEAVFRVLAKSAV
jgi:hypothetical protein